MRNSPPRPNKPVNINTQEAGPGTMAAQPIWAMPTTVTKINAVRILCSNHLRILTDDPPFMEA